MTSIICFVMIVKAINISGYIETRPYLAWNDSVNLFGYNRGWLELKQDYESYGAQIALDCQVWYDSTAFASIVDNISISRLALWVGKENRRVTIGKQRIYWGVARIFRPLDILNPTNYFEPGYERTGANAILGHYSIGDLSGIRAIVQPRFDIKKSLYGVRYSTNLWQNDIGLNVFHRSLSKITIVGAEITGEAEIGYWAEASHTWLDNQKYFKTSVGIDYTFPFYVYTMAEFFYDQSGAVSSSNYDYPALVRGERSTLGQQYLYTSIGSVYNPFLRPSINAIINLKDKGFILLPTIMYSINDNAGLNLGFNLFFGTTDSEFRNISSYTGQVYCWLKVYF